MVLLILSASMIENMFLNNWYFINSHKVYGGMLKYLDAKAFVLVHSTQLWKAAGEIP